MVVSMLLQPHLDRQSVQVKVCEFTGFGEFRDSGDPPEARSSPRPSMSGGFWSSFEPKQKTGSERLYDAVTDLNRTFTG